MLIKVVSQRKIVEYLQLSFQFVPVVEGLIKQEIILSKADELAIQPSEQELQEAADLLRRTKKLFHSEDTLSWLEDQYLSLDDFDQLIYIEATTKKVIDHLFCDQVELFFDQHREESISAVIQEVILDDEDLALQLFTSLSKQEITFREVARQYIQDPHLRRLEGYRGIFTRKQLHPDVGAAVFAVDGPQFLKPIVTSLGVHLIHVEEIISPTLTETWQEQILQNLFQNWLKNEIRQVQVSMPELNKVLKLGFG